MFADELETEARRIWQRDGLLNHKRSRYYEMEAADERDERCSRLKGHRKYATEPWQKQQRGITNAGAR